MRHYELTYLISPDLSEDDLGALSEKINSFMLAEGGILDKSLKIVKRKLGYPIKKTGSGFLKTITFHLKPEKLPSLKKNLKDQKNILRFVLFQKTVKKVRRQAREALKKPIPEPKEPKAKAKVELKDIEKKLEEILEE